MAAELVAFRAALGRLGFNNQQQDAINAQGLISMQSLLFYQKDQIKRICKVIREHAENPLNINVMQEQWLETMRYWVRKRSRL
jgi:hypothetical protein